MEIGDLERIRFVTRRFGELQGFRRLVPVGLLALGGAGLSSLTGWLLLLPAVLFAGACLLFLGAGRYYRDTFGEVEPAAEVSSALLMVDGPAPRLQPAIPPVPRVLLLGGLACAVFILFQLLLWPPWVTIGSEVVDWTGDTARTRAMLIQMLYGLCGLFFLATWWLREQRLSQGHHLGLGLLLCGLAALAPWFVPAAVHFGAALLLCGSSLIAAGLLDHRQIVRVLGFREEV